MVRVRREKERSSVNISKHKKTTSKGYVLALGGSRDDSNALDEQGAVSGTASNDPGLTTDVSNFLKELGLQKSRPKAKSKGKEKETVPSKLTDKQVRRRHRERNDSIKTTLLSKDEFPGQMAELKVKPTKTVSIVKPPFIFQPTSQWYSVLPPPSPNDSVSPFRPDQFSLLSTKAAELHEMDIKTFQTSSTANSSTSEAGFLSKIIHSGTLSDRLSALTLLVQSSPLHNVRALETLKSMAERGKGKGGREESLKALRCVVDWWVGGGAPGRKLKYFRDQPLLHPDVNDEYLLVWYFEDWLKKYFFSVLQILENLSLDSLPYVRTQSLALIFTLLRDKPEQEQNLLRLLVNKLGDIEKSICSRASYHLLQLLQTHPFMKAVVVREIVALVMKPSGPASSSPSTATQSSKHIKFTDKKTNSKLSGVKKHGNAHAKYYAAVTFNQVVLMPTDKDVAATLLDVYFEMFKEILGEGREEQEDVEDGQTGLGETVKIDKKGRVLDSGKGKGAKGKSATSLHVKGAAGFAEVEDSNSKLVSAILTGVNRALPFANIHADDSRINKHIDTLFFITHTSTFNISLQALMLIQQITASLSSSSKSKLTPPTVSKSITERYYRALYASLHDARLATSSKQAMYLNLFFKSVKADPASLEEGGSNGRAKALIRRFTQVLVSGGGGAPEFVAGGLYLLGELFGSVPGLRVMISHPSLESDEERYDPRKRDPQYAHASSSSLWELVPLRHHYHPAVSLHAHQLLCSQPLTASPDLSQNTLSHFLDRFVYKNPKKPKEGDQGGINGGHLGKGGSAMQPAASSVDGVKLLKGENGYVGEELVNEKTFLKKKRADVPVDQVFFHDYFTRKHEKEKALAARTKGQNNDEVTEEQENESSDGAFGRDDEDHWDEDVDSDAKEAEIWKAMKATMPKFEADDEELKEDSEGEDGDAVPDLDGYSEIDEDQEAEGEEDSDGVFSLAEASDDDDLVPVDGVILDYDDSGDGQTDEKAEWGGISGNKKRKRVETEQGGKRKKRRSLPTFASYEDYAKMIEDGPEDDID